MAEDLKKEQKLSDKEVLARECVRFSSGCEAYVRRYLRDIHCPRCLERYHCVSMSSGIMIFSNTHLSPM